jgi:ribonuclease R
MIDHNLPIAFSDEVEAEAKKIITTIDEAEIGRRRDFRKITTFTIDPIDAKDFDDALSIREIKKGRWEIGIHIADVSHYVKPGSILDNEAYARATSVYLVDRCVPMLPEILSNGVCSLRPDEEKLCYSAVFEMDESGKVLTEWFGRTVILSKRRFNYDEAQDIVDSGKGDLATELTFLDSMAKKLRAERFKKGSINFERSEVKFRLDAQGNPTGVFLKENKDSNKLIEEFMLLANRKVAEFCSRKSESSPNRPFVYRTHDDPDPERISEFSRFLKKLGYTLRTGSRKGITESINQLLVEVHGKNEQNIIETLAVRTMAKAKYTTNNIGHYGLGFDYYTHFTSPIRRYPDVMVHRLLDKQLKNAKAESQDAMEQSCKHSSEMEVRAEKAERESVKFMQARFLSNSIGLIFEGIISGVTKWGIFVELTENHCEGMVRLKDIDDDFYYFDEENYRVVGQRTKNEYRLGDKVFVRIARADAAQRQIDMVLVKGK